MIRFAYNDTQIILQFETEGTGTVTASDLSHRYFWQPGAVDQLMADEQVDTLTAPGAVVLPLSDHLGTIRDLAVYDEQTEKTTVATHRNYDTFGHIIYQTPSLVDCLFAFTARPFDESTGLQNNHRRWYNATIARWLSTDPISFTAGDANIYRYVANGPIDKIDPTGKAWWNLWICDYGEDLGKRIGTGYGVLTGNGFESDVKLAKLRQTRAIEQMSSPKSNITSAEFAKTRLSSIVQGLSNSFERACQVADAALAAGELTVAVVTIVMGGMEVRSTQRAVAKKLGQEVEQWLGKESRMIVNEAGDRIFISKDGLRRVQFHFNKTTPHTSPHVHVDLKANGKWIKSRFYPKDVPPY